MPWRPNGKQIGGATLRVLFAIAAVIESEPGVNAAVLLDALSLEWDIDWGTCAGALQLAIELGIVDGSPDPTMHVGLA